MRCPSLEFLFNPWNKGLDARLILSMPGILPANSNPISVHFFASTNCPNLTAKAAQFHAVMASHFPSSTGYYPAFNPAIILYAFLFITHKPSSHSALPLWTLVIEISFLRMSNRLIIWWRRRKEWSYTSVETKFSYFNVWLWSFSCIKTNLKNVIRVKIFGVGIVFIRTGCFNYVSSSLFV